MSGFEEVIARIAGNPLSQRLIERVFLRCQSLMGIGSGDAVVKSGERSIIDLLQTRFLPPYCIFDVGSNTGQFVDLLLQRIGDQRFSLHCFEPSAEAFSTLRHRFGGHARFILNNLALGSQKGQKTLYYDKPGSQLASLTKRNLEHFNLTFEEHEAVEVETLDTYCAANSIDRIHLMKVDVEGHELDVFLGCRRMLASHAIDLISFEFGGCNIDTKTFFRDYYDFFQKAQMSLYRITTSGYFHPITAYREIQEQFRTTNYLATRNAANR
ncbi:MAG: FkbM family methyltransferase [Thermodesulfobacteriota bacterium]